MSVVSGIFPIGTFWPDTVSQEFAHGMTIEAWVKPEQLPGGGGRIVDKLTPGQADGLLLDSYPGNSLRLIVGDAHSACPGCAAAGPVVACGCRGRHARRPHGTVRAGKARGPEGQD